VAPQIRPWLHVAVVLCFVVLVSIFLGPRIYVDQTLLVGDGLYYVDPSFRAAVPANAYTTGPLNFLTHVDNALNGYPRMHYVQTTLSAGEIPWWNPYIGLGIPGAGTASATFEPIELVLGRFVSVPMLSNVKAVAALVLGGYGTFLLVVTLGASRTAALFAGVAFVFSGWTVAWLGRTNMLAEAWMPWLFWAAERVFRGASMRFVGAVALFSGFACLSSHPQTGVQILASLGLYIALRAGAAGHPRPVLAGRLGLIGAALVVGVGVALVQLVPSADLISNAELPAQGRAVVRNASDIVHAAWYALLGDWTVIRRDLPTAVMTVAPLFFGSAATESYWWRGLNMMEMMAYAGLLSLFFGAYAAARRREIPAVRVWLVLVLVAFGAMYALPVFNAVNYLPVIALANNGRLRLLFHFALIVSAAFGLDRLLSDLAERRPGWARWVGAYAGVVVLIPMGTYGVLRFMNLPAPAPVMLLHSEAGVVMILAALAALIALHARGALGATPFRALLLSLAFADPLWHFGNFNPPIPTAHVFPDTPLVRFLKADPSLFRVSSGTGARVMTAETKLPYRLFDIDTFDVLNVRRHAKLQETVNERALDGFKTLRSFDFRDPARHRGLISLMNVKYLLLPGAHLAPSNPFHDLPGFRLVYDREARVYENLDVMPRVFLSDRATHVSAEQALAAVTARGFNPRGTVLLEDPASPRLPTSPGGTAGPARVTALSANRVVVQAHPSRPSYLVLSDTNYPGWRARVDGRPTPIYQANYLFRAVYLAPGEHEIEFTFMPTSYRLALAGTLASMALVGGCFAWDGLARIRGGRDAARYNKSTVPGHRVAQSGDSFGRQGRA
jgi:hypothetical protein